MVDQGFHGVLVHGLEAELGGDCSRIAATLEHLGENLLGLGGGERPFGLHLHEVGEAVGIEVGGALDGEVVHGVGDDAGRVGAGGDGGSHQPVEASFDDDGNVARG